MSFESLLDQTIYKFRLTSSQNALGEWVVSGSLDPSGIKARVMPLTDEERMTYAGRFPHVTYKIYVPYSANIAKGDRIQYENQTYYVHEVLWDSSHLYKKLLASEYASY